MAKVEHVGLDIFVIETEFYAKCTKGRPLVWIPEEKRFIDIQPKVLFVLRDIPRQRWIVTVVTKIVISQVVHRCGACQILNAFYVAF